MTYVLPGLCVVLILALALLHHRYTVVKEHVARFRNELASMSITNPWKSQLMLMYKSNQHVATYPMITKNSVLYGALVLEEGAETLVALGKGLEEVSAGRGSELHLMAKNLVHVAKIMGATSLMVRKNLERTTEEPATRLLSREVARELLDGCTDLHVVTAGLGLACGLPGQAGYDRVSTSNLSKANPVTGLIDKTEDGKWIKGINYQEPDLDSLLDPYYSDPQHFKPIPPLAAV